MRNFARPLAVCVPLVMGLAVAGCGGGEPPVAKGTGPVVAEIGSRVITVPELRDELRPARSRAGPPPANLEHRRRTLERIVTLELTEHVARDRGLLDDPRYAERARAVEREARRWKQEALRRLLAEDLVEDFVPAEQDVRAHYEESKARFRGTLLHLREIVTAEEKTALEALAEVREGAPFQEVAASRSIAPSASEGGRIGPFAPEVVPEDLAPEVRRLRRPDDLVGPFREPRGWTILLLERRETGVPQELDHVRPTIERMLRREEMERRYEQLIEAARQRVGVSIDEAVLTDDALFENEKTR